MSQTQSPNLVIGEPDVKFFRGRLYGYRADGTLSAVPFGELQGVSLKDTAGWKELRGPGSRVAVAVGMTERKISGDASYAKLRAHALQMMRGGTVALGTGADVGKTIYTASINDQPIPFLLHLTSPDNGTDEEMVIYGCLAPDVDIPMKMDDFTIEKFTFMAYGDPTTGILYIRKYLGDHTSDPAVPAATPALPMTGAAGSQTTVGVPAAPGP